MVIYFLVKFLNKFRLEHLLSEFKIEGKIIYFQAYLFKFETDSSLFEQPVHTVTITEMSKLF